MSIKKFLAERAAGQLTTNTQYIFVGTSYPWLFCSHCLSLFVKNAGRSKATIIDAEVVDFADIERQLGMSFLGSREFFWLGDLTRLSLSVQKQLFAFLSHYEGPHQVGCFINEKQLDNKQEIGRELVFCDELLSPQDVKLLWQLFFPEFLFDDFLKRLDQDITVEYAMLKGLYLYVGGISGEKALEAWRPYFVTIEHSLFKVAQYFFAKDKASFLPLWYAVKDEYPPEFWIAYWSEQLWQAHAYVSRALKGDLTLEKKGNRLPFSFIQRDWRRYKLNEFAVAHALLYGIDCALKNGSSDAGIDLFVLRFITGSFEKSRQ